MSQIFPATYPWQDPKKKKKKKKNNFVDAVWNGKKIRVFLDKNTGWRVIPLENQYISQDDKVIIIKAVLNNAR